MNQATYQLRIDEKTKQDSFAVFEEMGMSPAEGMRVFLRMVARTKSIPFTIRIPNEATQVVMAEADAGVGVVKHNSVSHMFEHLRN